MFAFKDNDLSVNIAIALALLGPSVVLIQALLSTSPQDSYTTTAGSDPVAKRVRPVVTLDDIRGPAEAQSMDSTVAVAAAKTPETLYQGACLACHAAGVANAPKLGDKAAWQPKAALGVDTLVQSVITGKGAMPPKGGSAYSDDEIRSVVEYMLSEAGLGS